MREGALTVEIGQMDRENQRFDHLGHVAQVWDQEKGIVYLAKERAPVLEKNKGRGICDEFCASVPIGFEEAKAGEWFLKPGCGMLRKKDGPYRFTESYEFLPLKGQVEQKGNCISFWSESSCVRGYNYFYEKRFQLSGRTLEISYHMRNRGNRPFSWQSYGHNFFLPGTADCGGLCLDLRGMPVKGLTLSCGNDVLTKETARYGDKRKSYRVRTVPQEPSLYVAEMEPDRGGSRFGAGYCYQLRSRDGSPLLREQGDFEPVKCKVWIDENCLCPEVFVEAHLAPEQDFYWKKQYTFL